jgi:hypothetical protein
MEASAANLAPAGSSPIERPTWLRMIVVAGLAGLVGGVAIFGVDAALMLTRLDADPDLLRLPTSSDGLWAWSSCAAKTVLGCWLFAWAGRRCIRDWTDNWDLRIWPVAIAIAIALASLDARRSLTLAGFALVVVVARNVALVPRPAPRWQPSRWKRAAVIVALAVVAIVALTYRPLHPLEAAFSDRDTDASFSFGSDGDPSRPSTELGFMIGNEGAARVTVRQVRAVEIAHGNVDVLTQRSGAFEAHSLADFRQPVSVERIARGDQLHGWLAPSRSLCQGPGRARGAKVWGLDVRYETLGVTGTQRLPIDPPARLRCPSRH